MFGGALTPPVAAGLATNPAQGANDADDLVEKIRQDLEGGRVDFDNLEGALPGGSSSTAGASGQTAGPGERVPTDQDIADMIAGAIAFGQEKGAGFEDEAGLGVGLSFDSLPDGGAMP